MTGPQEHQEQPAADELRVRIHQHLKAHPDLTVYEIARALKASESSVRIRLKAMKSDGEASSTTEKRLGDSRPTTRWSAT